MEIKISLQKLMLRGAMFFGIMFLCLITARDAKAQTCSGSNTSTGLYRCVQSVLTGRWSCATDGTQTWPCNYSPGLGACASISYSAENCTLGVNGSSCSASNRVDGTPTGGCTTIPAPPPPTSGPPPPPPPGTCTSGDPFGPPAIANCGAVGRVNGSGSCGAGCMCCAFSSPPSPICQWQNSVPVRLNLTVGQVAPLQINAFFYQGLPWVGGDVRFASTVPAVATVLPALRSICCGASYGFSPQNATVTAVSVGNASIRGTYTMRNGAASEICQGFVSVHVTLPIPQCTQPVVTAVPQCSLLPGGISTATFQWPYSANADQYSFSVIDSSTGTVVPGTDTGFVDGNSAIFNFCNTVGDTCTHVVNLPEGVTNYQGKVIAHSSQTPALCTDSTPGLSAGFLVSVCPAASWWQAQNGDVITQGNITSDVPATVAAPNNRVSQDGSGGYPGVVMTSSTGAVDAGSGVVSSQNWAAQAPFSGREPTYSDFIDLIPVTVTPTDPGANPTGASFLSGGATDTNGYTWYVHNGDMTISSDMAFPAGSTRKVILFVSGTLTINGKITLDPTQAFFMTIVGKTAGISGGDIKIGSGVTTLGATPTVSGIFFCEGHFSTGTTGATDGPLNILGSVAALEGVTLERDLGPGNVTQPAETFNVSPELLLNYPPALTFKRPIWKEVAP